MFDKVGDTLHNVSDSVKSTLGMGTSSTQYTRDDSINLFYYRIFFKETL